MMEPGPGRLVDAARSGPSEARRADEHALSTLLTQDSSQSTPPSRSHESDEIACMHGSVHTTPTSGITRGRWVEYCHPPLAPAIGLVSGELPGRQTRKQVRYPSRDQGTKALRRSSLDRNSIDSVSGVDPLPAGRRWIRPRMDGRGRRLGGDRRMESRRLGGDRRMDGKVPHL